MKESKNRQNRKIKREEGRKNEEKLRNKKKTGMKVGSLTVPECLQMSETLLVKSEASNAK